MTKLYVVIQDDHSCDLGIFPFLDTFKAIQYAAEIAEEYKQDDFETEEQEDLPEKWLYHATYSSEGDRVFVEITEIQDE
jgi:hypothetical protein